MPTLVQCPACKANVSSDAVACPQCGHPFSGAARTIQVKTKKQTSGCAVVIAVIFGLMVYTFFRGASEHANTPAPVVTAAAAPSTAAQASTAALPVAPALMPAWDYETAEDPMTGRTVKSATLESTNTVSFGFPYQGDQHGTLFIATYPRTGHQVRFSIESGQFMCRRFDNCTVTVRFDDGKPMRMAASEPDDGDTTTIFILPTHTFVRRLKSAKEVHIEASFYQQGNQVFDFSSPGFDPAKAGF